MSDTAEIIFRNPVYYDASAIVDRGEGGNQLIGGDSVLYIAKSDLKSQVSFYGQPVGPYKHAVLLLFETDHTCCDSEID